MKVALYARVSKDDLRCENQKSALMSWVQREKLNEKDWDYFQEEMTTRKTRPIKESVMVKYRNGGYDVVVCAKLDRFARSLQELIMDVEGIVNSGGRFVAISNGMDLEKKSYNASQQLMLNIFASFAQFEREMIRERTNDGLMTSRALGKILGRHPTECGCGWTSPDGKIHHGGHIKPVRDEHNKVVGWVDTRTNAPFRPKQTPNDKPNELSEVKPIL